jgi:hypothetical protein
MRNTVTSSGNSVLHEVHARRLDLVFGFFHDGVVFAIFGS